jgi:hypothetical protein
MSVENFPAIRRAELRQKIIERMNELVLPRKVEQIPRPSIDELERLLNQSSPPDIRIEPDGTVVEYFPQTTTVGKVADAILDLFEGAKSRTGA